MPVALRVFCVAFADFISRTSDLPTWSTFNARLFSKRVHLSSIRWHLDAVDIDPSSSIHTTIVDDFLPKVLQTVPNNLTRISVLLIIFRNPTIQTVELDFPRQLEQVTHPYYVGRR